MYNAQGYFRILILIICNIFYQAFTGTSLFSIFYMQKSTCYEEIFM